MKNTSKKIIAFSKNTNNKYNGRMYTEVSGGKEEHGWYIPPMYRISIEIETEFGVFIDSVKGNEMDVIFDMESKLRKNGWKVPAFEKYQIKKENENCQELMA